MCNILWYCIPVCPLEPPVIRISSLVSSDLLSTSISISSNQDTCNHLQKLNIHVISHICHSPQEQRRHAIDELWKTEGAEINAGCFIEHKRYRLRRISRSLTLANMKSVHADRMRQKLQIRQMELPEMEKAQKDLLGMYNGNATKALYLKNGRNQQ